MHNNEILLSFQETTINTKTEPDKPPPSYEDAISGTSNNVLPSYQQALIMGDELRSSQEDISLIETENPNLSQVIALNIPIEHPDNGINDSNCFYNYLKNNKKTIQTRILPYAIELVIIGILFILLETKAIKLHTFAFVSIATLVFYIFYDAYLRKQCSSNSN
jgi:hypothetical protein